MKTPETVSTVSPPASGILNISVQKPKKNPAKQLLLVQSHWNIAKAYSVRSDSCR